MRRRLRGLIVAAPCVAMILVAWSLTPRPSGVGTAQEMGLPHCSILINTGWPCPSCGLTTAVAAAAQGDAGAALRAQPFGLVLVVAAVILGLAGLTELLTAGDLLGRRRPRWWWLAAGLGGMVLGWAVKLAMGVADGSLPLR